MIRFKLHELLFAYVAVFIIAIFVAWWTWRTTIILLDRSVSRTKLCIITVLGATTTLISIAVTTIALPIEMTIACFGFLWFFCGLFCRAAFEPAHQTLEQTRFSWSGVCWFGCWCGRNRCRLRRCNAFDKRFRFGFDFLLFWCPAHVGRWCINQLETGFDVFEAWVIMAQALDMMVWRLKMTVGNQDQIDLEA